MEGPIDSNHLDWPFCSSNEITELLCSGLSVTVKLNRKVLSTVVKLSSRVIQFLLMLIVKVVKVVPSPYTIFLKIVNPVVIFIIGFVFLHIVFLLFSYIYYKVKGRVNASDSMTAVPSDVVSDDVVVSDEGVSDDVVVSDEGVSDDVVNDDDVISSDDVVNDDVVNDDVVSNDVIPNTVVFNDNDVSNDVVSNVRESR